MSYKEMRIQTNMGCPYVEGDVIEFHGEKYGVAYVKIEDKNTFVLKLEPICMKKFDPPRLADWAAKNPGRKFEDYFEVLAEYIIEYFKELAEGEA